MLDAMRKARFASLHMVRRHPAAGLILQDNTNKKEIWLVDLGWETWMKERTPIMTRYYTPGPFSMTAGVGIPLDRPLLDRATESLLPLRHKSNEEMCEDPRFAEAFYRAAIEQGLMDRIRLQDPPAGGYAA
jgi:hypothetical protein